MATRAEQLYKEDFYAWTRDQAAALRRLADERWTGPLDLLHLAEEVEDLGMQARNAVRSQLERAIEHLLKLEYSPAVDPRPGWMNSVDDARARIEDAMTPTIRRDAEALLSTLYDRARRRVARDLAAHGERDAARALPGTCPYGLDDVLADEWWPANRHGLTDEIWAAFQMATRPEQLYEDDFYAWTRDQAQALRRLAATRPNVELDFEHLIEEVADWGISQRDAVRSQLRRIIEHCLKLEYSPARAPRVGWYETIMQARTEIEDKITPTIRRGLPRRLPRLWQQARRDTAAALRLHGEHATADALPVECPYRLAALLRHDWHPRSRHGLEP
jgi:hypothetical protein